MARNSHKQPLIKTSPETNRIICVCIGLAFVGIGLLTFSSVYKYRTNGISADAHVISAHFSGGKKRHTKLNL